MTKNIDFSSSEFTLPNLKRKDPSDLGEKRLAEIRYNLKKEADKESALATIGITGMVGGAVTGNLPIFGLSLLVLNGCYPPDKPNPTEPNNIEFSNPIKIEEKIEELKTKGIVFSDKNLTDISKYNNDKTKWYKHLSILLKGFSFFEEYPISLQILSRNGTMPLTITPDPSPTVGGQVYGGMYWRQYNTIDTQAYEEILIHECGHAINYNGGELSLKAPFKDAFYTDIINLLAKKEEKSVSLESTFENIMSNIMKSSNVDKEITDRIAINKKNFKIEADSLKKLKNDIYGVSGIDLSNKSRGPGYIGEIFAEFVLFKVKTDANEQMRELFPMSMNYMENVLNGQENTKNMKESTNENTQVDKDTLEKFDL